MFCIILAWRGEEKPILFADNTTAQNKNINMFVFMNFLATPGGEAFWGERSYMFSDRYRQYVQTEIIPREAHPLAKPWGAFEIGQ